MNILTTNGYRVQLRTKKGGIIKHAYGPKNNQIPNNKPLIYNKKMYLFFAEFSSNNIIFVSV